MTEPVVTPSASDFMEISSFLDKMKPARDQAFSSNFELSSIAKQFNEYKLHGFPEVLNPEEGFAGTQAVLSQCPTDCSSNKDDHPMEEQEDSQWKSDWIWEVIKVNSACTKNDQCQGISGE